MGKRQSGTNDVEIEEKMRLISIREKNSHEMIRRKGVEDGGIVGGYEVIRDQPHTFGE